LLIHIKAGTQYLSHLMLAHAVLDDGERFEVGDRIDLGRGDAVIGPVHDVQYVLETFNFWHNLSDYVRSAARARGGTGPVAAQLLLRGARRCPTGAVRSQRENRKAPCEPARAPAPAARAICLMR
jgi:hypothetical protein